MYVTPPWKPTSVELTTANRTYWWQVGDAGERPERWTVRADVAETDGCPDEVRHVGLFELAVAELTEDGRLLSPTAAGVWAREFLAEAVADLHTGTLVPELERVIAPGPARLVLIRHMYLHDAWRGCGLAPPLLSAALHRFAAMARLAACRLRPDDITEQVPGLTRAEATSAARHGSRLLERTGFFSWNGVHLVGLHDGQQHEHRAQLTEDVTGTELEDGIKDFFAGDGRERP